MTTKVNVKNVCVALAVTIGAVWVLATFVLSLWTKTAAADRVTDNLKSAFSSAGIRQEQADASAVNAVTRELTTKTLPLIATQLHTTPAAVTSVLASKFPAVGKLLGTTDNNGVTFADRKPYLAHAADYLTTVVNAITSRQGDYAKASAIPTKNLPTKALAWLFLVLGLVTLALVGLALTKPAALRGLAVAITVFGLVVVAVTLVLNVPGKTQSLDRVTDTFQPVFTTTGPLSIVEGQKYLAAVRQADVELETKVVPALPQLLNLSPSALVAALRANSPTVAAALLDKDPNDGKLSVLDGIVTRFDAIASTVRKDIPDFRRTAQIPGLGWPATSVQALLALPALGLVLVGAGLLTTAGGRKRPASQGSSKALASVGK